MPGFTSIWIAFVIGVNTISFLLVLWAIAFWT